MWEGPGFVDHHTHLLRVAAGDVPPYDLTDSESIAAFHRSVHWRGTTPMDIEQPAPSGPDLGDRLARGLDRAARLGLVQVTEAGMTDWAYYEALRRLRDDDRLPVAVRLYVASGVAEPGHRPETGDPMIEVEGVKFYADGWLGSRTCAVREPFDDTGSDGYLFLDALTLARRAEPFASRGWRLATHAIGDRAIEAALDAYAFVYGDDCATAAPRIEHAQVLRPDLVERMAELGVTVCIQPGFAHSDAATAKKALGARSRHAYRWELLLDAGVDVVTGSDYPIEDLAPLRGLERLVDILGLETALGLMTDAEAGTTVLSEDPRDAPLSEVEVVDVEVSRRR